MRRRQFATLGVAAALLAVSESSHAQLPRIGWLSPGDSTGTPEKGFRQGVKEVGYIEGQNVIVDYRFGGGNYDRLAGLAADLMQLRPDVLVAIGTAVTTVLKDATDKIPVVALLGELGRRGLRCQPRAARRKHHRRIDDARCRRTDRQAHRTSQGLAAGCDPHRHDVQSRQIGFGG